MAERLNRCLASVVLAALTLAAVPFAAGATESAGSAADGLPATMREVSASTVSVVPETSYVELGFSVDVAIRVEGADDLTGYHFVLTYEPSVVTVTDVEDGGFLEGQSVLEFDFSVPGTVDFNAARVPPPYEGVSGSGILAVITLQGASLGSSDLTLVEVDLSKGDETSENPDALENGTVIVQEEVCEAVELTGLTVDPNPVVVKRHATFEAEVSGSPPITYTWDFDGDGSIDLTGGEATVSTTYPTTGTYTATLTASNCPVEGPFTDTLNVSVTVTPCQPVTIDAVHVMPNPVQMKSPVRLNADVSGTPPFTYTWDFDDGSPPVSGTGFATVTHTYSATGTYQVDLTVENQCGDQQEQTSVQVIPVTVYLPIILRGT